jgi:Helix-loop-helix DNA-binding domain
VQSFDSTQKPSLCSTLEQRREDARRQRQNAEQRRRDQLRDGYDRLQSVLPSAKEKMSKVRLIECGQFCFCWASYVPTE